MQGLGGVEKTNFDATEGRKDGMTDKANTKCPLAILWLGHKKIKLYLQIFSLVALTPFLQDCAKVCYVPYIMTSLFVLCH